MHVIMKLLSNAASRCDDLRSALDPLKLSSIVPPHEARCSCRTRNWELGLRRGSITMAGKGDRSHKLGCRCNDL